MLDQFKVLSSSQTWKEGKEEETRKKRGGSPEDKTKGSSYPTWGHHCAFPLYGHKFVTMTVMLFPLTPPVPQLEQGAEPVLVSL